jgi:hypothetical protein
MTIKIDNFIGKFPKVDLPVILSEDAHHEFSKENDPLNTPMIDVFIAKYEANEPDDFTEYIPCFSLPLSNKPFAAIVYWKAGLLTYDYVLATYDMKSGVMLDKRAISGTKVVDNAVKRSVAIIKEDLSIDVAEGVSETGVEYTAETSKAKRFSILDTGHIEQDY